MKEKGQFRVCGVKPETRFLRGGLLPHRSTNKCYGIGVLGPYNFNEPIVTCRIYIGRAHGEQYITNLKYFPLVRVLVVVD